MVEFDLAAEKKLDGAVADWLLTARRPSQQDLSRVYLKAVELVEAGYPISKSLVERGYRVLLSEKSVALVTEKLSVPESVHARTLSVEEYRELSASDVARRYLHNDGGWFRNAVDELIRLKKI